VYKKVGELIHSNRKIVLEIIGWTDLLLYLGIPYGSGDSLVLVEELMGFI
jgi:ribonucleoside-diphosphate reductase alpha chain